MARNQAIAAWYQRQTLLQSEEVGEPKAPKHHVSRGQWVSDSGEYLGIPSLWSLFFFGGGHFFGGRGNRKIMRISIGFWVILFADKPKSWNQMGNFPHNYVSLVERKLTNDLNTSSKLRQIDITDSTKRNKRHPSMEAWA